LIARGSRVTALGGFLPIDIDGDRLHGARHACETGSADAGCSHCPRYALREYTRLAAALPDAAWVDVLRSGGRGLHIYLRDDVGLRARLLRTAQEARIRIDVNVSLSPKATIALPGSLHAGTMLPVTPLERGQGMPIGLVRGHADYPHLSRRTPPVGVAQPGRRSRRYRAPGSSPGKYPRALPA
jgi:DNA primase catalytic subunit